MLDEKAQRVLLKVSGEQIAGKQKTGIDLEFLDWLAGEVKEVLTANIQLAIVVGGGNYIRGEEIAKNGIELATGHYMGMLSTVINGMALTDKLEHNDIKTRIQSSITMPEVAEPFIRRKAIRHMEKGRVVVCAAGTGRPYVTTDTASVTFALELGCNKVLKATNVDGVYDKDPHRHDDAKRYAKLTFQEAVENAEIKVMDKAAMGLAMEQEMPITVFDINEKGNILKAAKGEDIGTVISLPTSGHAAPSKPGSN